MGNETSEIMKRLHSGQGKLALIYDGTYIRHGKSSKNLYQRKSYSGQKKTSLCKPFTICTTTGYIVDVLGPFIATKNDAEIMRNAIANPAGLGGFLRGGDICFVDRGFRDVKEELRGRNYTVCMPALKGNRKQLTTEEANYSRFVTKIRWIVEAIRGIIGRKYQILHGQRDNKLLPRIGSLTRIACFLNNTFGKRLKSDENLMEVIVQRMIEMRHGSNTLAAEVAQN